MACEEQHWHVTCVICQCIAVTGREEFSGAKGHQSAIMCHEIFLDRTKFDGIHDPYAVACAVAATGDMTSVWAWQLCHPATSCLLYAARTEPDSRRIDDVLACACRESRVPFRHPVGYSSPLPPQAGATDLVQPTTTSGMDREMWPTAWRRPTERALKYTGY